MQACQPKQLSVCKRANRHIQVKSRRQRLSGFGRFSHQRLEFTAKSIDKSRRLCGQSGGAPLVLSCVHQWIPARHRETQRPGLIWRDAERCATWTLPSQNRVFSGRQTFLQSTCGVCRNGERFAGQAGSLRAARVLFRRVANRPAN